MSKELHYTAYVSPNALGRVTGITVWKDLARVTVTVEDGHGIETRGPLKLRVIKKALLRGTPTDHVCIFGIPVSASDLFTQYDHVFRLAEKTA